MGEWNERAHPRHLAGRNAGRFRDRTDWADTISGAIDQLMGSPEAKKIIRHDYTRQLLDEADAIHEMNVEDDEDGTDEELLAQTNLVEEGMLRDSPGLRDSAEHLRGMMIISYLDDEDLPPRPPDDVWL